MRGLQWIPSLMSFSPGRFVAVVPITIEWNSFNSSSNILTSLLPKEDECTWFKFEQRLRATLRDSQHIQCLRLYVYDGMHILSTETMNLMNRRSSIWIAILII